MLSESFKEHITAPRNRGIIHDPDGVGEMIGPTCGDQVVVYLRMSGDRIARATFTTHGCWVAVAMASLITEMASGMTVRQALKLDGEALAREKVGLPEDKWPCAIIVSDALHRAISDWEKRQSPHRVKEG